MYKRDFTPEKISELRTNEIFVFGSNLAGQHGGGAAHLAYKRFGAVWGQGVGMQGQSYAIPTMQGGVETIKPYVDDFIQFAQSRPDLLFYVTRIGCGIAGFKDEDIAPLFALAINVENILLPKEFVSCITNIISENETMKEYEEFRYLFRKVFILGQVDHGRTSLANAMSKVMVKKSHGGICYDKIDETSVWEDGFPIRVSYITIHTGKYRYKIFDEFGYADEMKLLLSGIEEPDCALVVVSAEEGIMPQTHEIMSTLRHLNINKIAIFINKCDKAKWDCINRTLNDVRRTISEMGFGNMTPIVLGSALGALEDVPQWEDSVLRLVDECGLWFEKLPDKSKEPFALPIEEVFVTSNGIVACGKIISGTIHEGDMVEIVGITHNEPLTSNVKAIERFKTYVEKAQYGDLVGLILRVEKNDIRKGEVVCKPKTHHSIKKFRASLLMLTTQEGGRKEPFFNKYRPLCLIYNHITTCEITITSGSPMVIPGNHVIVDVELLYSMMVVPGMHFSIRDGSQIVGVGIVTEILI